MGMMGPCLRKEPPGNSELPMTEQVTFIWRTASTICPKLVLLVVNGHQCWKTPTNEHPAFNLRLPEVWVCVVRAWKQ